MPAKPKASVGETPEPPAPAARKRAPEKGKVLTIIHTLPLWRGAFLAALSSLGNVSAAAAAASVGRRTVYDLREADEAFAREWKEALEEGADALEAEARKRAFAGSDTLLIFLLKGARPEKYRENIKARVEHSGEVNGTLTHVSEEELAKTRDARRRYLEEFAAAMHGQNGANGRS